VFITIFPVLLSTLTPDGMMYLLKMLLIISKIKKKLAMNKRELNGMSRNLLETAAVKKMTKGKYLFILIITQYIVSQRSCFDHSSPKGGNSCQTFYHI